MFNTSDLIFLISAMALIGVSYYFLVMRKPTIESSRVQQVIEERRTLAEEQKEEAVDPAKEARKRQKREEREARRQAVEAQQKAEEDRRRRMEEKEEKEKEEERKIEEAERKIEEERLRKEEEEYQKWKQYLVVEEEGTMADDEKIGENLLANFISYISLRRVVEVEELAAAFGLTNKVCVQRLKDLEANGSLTGVLDDRGKYIFITPEETESLMKMLNQKKRLTKSDLIDEFSKIVRLEPDEESLKKIKEQEASLNKDIENELSKLTVEDNKKE